MTGDISVRLKFYDNARPSVVLMVNKDTTANQFYNKITAEVDVKDNFQLFCNDNPIKKCNTSLSQIFQGNEVDVLLVLMIDGASPKSLISPCPDCPGDCGTCNDLTDDLIINDIVIEREDAWSVLCKVFNISTDVQHQIAENNEDENVRCIDVMHHVYHSNPNFTWDIVKVKVKSHDPHLAKVISECDFSHLN